MKHLRSVCFGSIYGASRWRDVAFVSNMVLDPMYLTSIVLLCDSVSKWMVKCTIRMNNVKRMKTVRFFSTRTESL